MAIHCKTNNTNPEKFAYIKFTIEKLTNTEIGWIYFIIKFDLYCTYFQK